MTSIEQSQLLIKSFRDIYSPRYRGLIVYYILNQEMDDSHDYYSYIDTTINLIEKENFVGSFASILYILCRYMKSKYGSDISVLQRIQRIKDLYSKESLINPLVLEYQKLL